MNTKRFVIDIRGTMRYRSEFGTGGRWFKPNHVG